MVPIHESDLAENRWKESQWGYYELWEKVESRFKKRRSLIIAITVLLFVVLSSIPIIRDRTPKWETLSAVRKLATEVNRMKLEASILAAPLNLEISSSETELAFRIAQVSSCNDRVVSREVRSGSLTAFTAQRGMRLVNSTDSEKWSLQPMVHSICYDPLMPTQPLEQDVPRVVGIAPVNDLTEGRLDRLSVLYLSGNSAEISFD